MFQLTFSDQSMGALNELDQREQLGLVDKLSSLTDDILSAEDDAVGRFQRSVQIF